MKAPEKIYISKELFRWSFDKPQSKSDIEYIRADAFIEKACKYLEPIIFSINSGDQPDTDKIIDDFKNYMKGE